MDLRRRKLQIIEEQEDIKNDIIYYDFEKEVSLLDDLEMK